ncbi:hypothetical protein FM076_31530 [Streptomyces albus subsp. chlorinus]|uniref:PD40 domain-containing protein n=1 Tax=Streptomyces albus TaxID=1888 RepID=UPI00156E4C8E|nr:PD40 domain-containing protein [Streptomyces albus]NSC25439.1 hypothetical protein [Streptomyces albus subsp. chlorinus]
MRGHRHHIHLAALALALTATVSLAGCGSGGGASGDGDGPKGEQAGKQGEQAAKKNAPKSGGAIPDRDVVVSAWCTVPANNLAKVTVEAWNPTSWKQVGSTAFTLPKETVLTNDEARSPLADLCEDGMPGQADAGSGEEGPNALAEPRLRQMFNDDFTRLAVVLRDSGTGGTRAAVVTPQGRATMVAKEDTSNFADAPTEQHPVFAPGSGGSEVWYMTKGKDEDAPRFFSSRMTGGKPGTPSPHGSGDQLTEQRPGFTLAGEPAAAITASVLRISPDGRKAAGFHELQGMNVVDVPRRATTQRDDDAPLSPLPSSCMPWGWTDDTTVLCGPREMTEDDPARKNNFWTVDTTRLREDEEPPGDVSGKPILPKTSRENTLRALSPDGRQIIITSRQGTREEHFRVDTKPGSAPEKIEAAGADQALRSGFVLEWR